MSPAMKVYHQSHAHFFIHDSYSHLTLPSPGALYTLQGSCCELVVLVQHNTAAVEGGRAPASFSASEVTPHVPHTLDTIS